MAVAALAARIEGLDRSAIAHAMGIAEYHGPRSQMMRVIDHPVMLKDGSGMGAMVGVQAARLAARGFTGGPALVASGPAWDDLQTRWMIHEQYFKPYPVCRWAQAPVEAALEVRPLIDGCPDRVIVETFHEARRLAVTRPDTTEEAQYSTAFPVAVALARGRVGPGDVSGDALSDEIICEIAGRITFEEDGAANDAFPGTRLARVRVVSGGREHVSAWHRPRWDADAPPTDADLAAKFDETAATASRPAPELRAALARFATLTELRAILCP